jgi:hypothetical protein
VLGRSRQPRMRLGAVVALAIAVGFVAWLVTSRGGSSFSTAPVTPIAPEALTVDGLRSVAKEIGHPVYWVGAKPGYTYELRRDRDDNIFIRYLPSGATLGAPGHFLSVGTYRLPDAYAAIQRAARNKNSFTVKLPNDGLAVFNTARPGAYWFAYRGSHYQVGVFSLNSPPLARKLVLEGRVVPVR